jgi:hypothetical protein
MPERRLDFQCECGTQCRVAVEVPASGSAEVEFVRHCEQGQVWRVPGKPLRYFEKKDGDWQQVPPW